MKGNPGEAKFIPAHEDYGLLAGFSLEILEFRAGSGPAALRVAGWIGADGRRARALCFHSGFRTERIVPTVPREDVIAALPGAGIPLRCGFDGLLNLEALGGNFSLVVTAVLEAETHTGETMLWLGEIVGRQEALPRRAPADAAAPLCLTCLGRTGSTLAMRLLNAHPSVVVAGGYPYEIKYAQRSFAALSRSLDDLLTGGVECSPSGEAQARFRDHARGGMLQATVAVIDGFYRSAAHAHGKDGITHFAEKCLPSFLPDIARDVYGSLAKEIILVRDPRDIFCSASSFNSRRGFPDFGAEHHAAADAWFRAIRHAFVQLAGCHARRPQALVIRYEDLVLDAGSTIPGILRYLDANPRRTVSGRNMVDVMQDAIFDPDQESAGHMTSPSARQSIGRWRAHDAPAVFHAEDEAYGQAMRTFGYL